MSFCTTSAENSDWQEKYQAFLSRWARVTNTTGRHSPSGRLETVVLTATFLPGKTPFVAIGDTTERKWQYFCALLCWLRDPRVGAVVFCENTATTCDFSRFSDIASREGKRLEILSFDGNTESARLGKGFGEGCILEHVMQQSSVLSESSAFYKCTGRVYVKNFPAVSASLERRSEGFFPLDMRHSIANKSLERLTVRNAWRRLRERSRLAAEYSRKAGARIWSPRLTRGCDTRFFKCGTGFFRAHLLDRYRSVDDHMGFYLEHAYYYRLRNQTRFVSETAPAFVGKSGTGGGELHHAFPESIVAEARAFL